MVIATDRCYTVLPAIGRRYVDFPITDVLQMMGRAGRPQYDQHGVAVIMVADTKKSFYKKVRNHNARHPMRCLCHCYNSLKLGLYSQPY